MRTVNFKILSLLVLLFLSLPLNAQNNNIDTLQPQIDSIQKVLKTQKEDTSKVITLNELAYRFFMKNDDTKIYQIAQIQLALAEKIGFKRGGGLAYKNFGNNNILQKDYPKALKNYFHALYILQEIKAEKDIGIIYYNISVTYHLQQNYTSAITFALKAIPFLRLHPNSENLTLCYFHIGFCYEAKTDYPHALQYYYQALKSAERIDNKWLISECYSHIANIFFLENNEVEALKNMQFALKYAIDPWTKAYVNGSIGQISYRKGKYAEALQKQLECLEFWKKVDTAFHDSTLFFIIHQDIGDIYKKQGELAFENEKKVKANNIFSEALQHYMISLNGNKRIGNNINMAYAYIEVGELYLNMNNIYLAKQYLITGLSLSLKWGDNENLKNCYAALSKLDSLQGDYKAAYLNYKKSIFYTDSIINEENIRKSEGYKLQYEFEKKEAVAKAEQDKKDAVTKAEIKNEKTIRNLLFVLAFLIITFSVYSFYRYKKKKQLQNQQSLMNERLRISRELHDEVGATLSGIAMYSHLTKKQIKNANTIEVEKSLDVMQQSAGEMVNKLNDIVWLVNPDQDSLQKLIQRLEEYARDMAAIKNMQVKVNVPEHLQEHSLPMESRRNIYLFCKEAINNAVKYSNGTILELNIKEASNTLEFSVSDNGKGFDAVMVRRGNGLENMQKRADEIGARLMLQSKQNEGCLVSMQLKVS